MADQKDGLGDYVRQVRESTQRYARDLLHENEKLLSLATTLHAEKLRVETELESARSVCVENDEMRRALDALTSERVRLTEQVSTLREQVNRHREIHASLIEQLSHMETSNRTFAEQYVEVEQTNSNLANLYVASYRIHGSLDRETVLTTMREIVINIIGSEEFAVLELSADGASLGVATSFGMDATRYAGAIARAGRIGETVASGVTYVASAADLASDTGDERMTACVPLKVEERVIGAIVIVSLLLHKPQLEALDYELFNLLATHAATALYCSDLHSELRARPRAVA
jgi:hypothetical protein